MTTDTLAKLAACPFCGKSHTLKISLASEVFGVEDEPYMHSEAYAVTCDASRPDGPGGCGASGGYRPTEAEAIEAWEARALTAQALPAAEPWGAQPFNAPVYPPDGTKSPFTVINLGLGKVQMGDSIHDHRLPALWFGTNGQGMGHEEVMNREAKPGETLAVVTFSNVEGLDVLLEAVQRIRRESFPQASQQAAQATAGWVPTEQFIADLAMAIDTIDESAKSLRDGHTVGGRWVSLSPIDVEVKAIYEEEAALVNRPREVAAALPQPQPQSAQTKGDAA